MEWIFLCYFCECYPICIHHKDILPDYGANILIHKIPRHCRSSPYKSESNDRHSRIPRMRNECKQPRRDKCASVSGILTNPPGEESASNDKVEVTTVMRLNSHKLDMLLPSWEQRESDKWQGFISTPCTIGLCYTTVNDSRVEGYEISGYFQSPGPSVGYANSS